jgi:hypothetical protein
VTVLLLEELLNWLPEIRPAARPSERSNLCIIATIFWALYVYLVNMS